MDNTGKAAIFQLIVLLVMSIPVAITAHLLAREKGRNVVLWTVLGCIPLLNFFCMSFFIGAANLKLERNLDELLQRKSEG